MRASSHLSSIPGFMTARVSWRAVAFAETTSILLRAKIWYEKVIQSSNIKLNKGDCFYTFFFWGVVADFIKNESLRLPLHLDLTLIWHCTCALFHKIDCRPSLNELRTRLIKWSGIHNIHFAIILYFSYAFIAILIMFLIDILQFHGIISSIRHHKISWIYWVTF